MSGSDDTVPVSSSVPGEFSIIERLFAPLAGEGAFALQDDAALFTPAPGRQLVLTKDAIAEGRHYLAGDPPGDVARKLLRVNLSDLAAKGATPRGYLLSCAWSIETGYDWMAAFAAGLEADQKQYGLQLLGGDTIRVEGPSVFSLTAIGDVAEGEMVLRSGARPGDDLWVTGTIGDGALGLLAAQGELEFLPKPDNEYLVGRYRVPEPPVTFGQGLSSLASAALDVSDGLLADARHLCGASEVGIEIARDAVPVSPVVRTCLSANERYWETVLGGGDDYQILFSAPGATREKIKFLTQSSGTSACRVGRVTEDTGRVKLFDAAGKHLPIEPAGFQHF